MSTSESLNAQLPALWQSGIPLDSAWIKFAKFFDDFAYTALRTYPGNDPDVLARHPRYGELQAWLPKTWEARKQKLLVTTRNERTHLLGEIYAGRLWAIGFRMLPNGSDEPVRIPRQHFFFVGAEGPDIRIDWEKRQLTVGGMTYFDIKIVRNPITQDGRLARARAKGSDDRLRSKGEHRKVKRPHPRATALPKKAPAKKTGGRPNTSREIRKALRQLLLAEPDSWSSPVKVVVRRVRGALLGEERRDVEVRGFKTSSMAKVIGNELSALRKPNKRNKRNKP
jgi:hypothetical protein